MCSSSPPAPRKRARLAMQEGEVAARTETRRGHRVARRLFQDQDQDRDQNQDGDHNPDENNDEGSETPRTYAAAEDNLTNQLSEQARQDLEKAKIRWNFDFPNERPLPGRWIWRKVLPGEDNEDPDDINWDTDENNIDQREKSETEASEKSEVLKMEGKD